jgi:hypothetical protein
MITAGRRGDEFLQVRAPAQPLTRFHGRAQPGLIGEFPRDRPRHPAAHVIKGLRFLDEIEHGVLDLGPRRVHVPLHRQIRTPGSVDLDARWGYHAALVRNGHMDRIGVPIRKPVQFGCCVVAERGTWAGGKDSRPQICPTIELTRERRIDTGVNPPPPPASDPELDHVLGEPGLAGLAAGDQARLASR